MFGFLTAAITSIYIKSALAGLVVLIIYGVYSHIVNLSNDLNKEIKKSAVLDNNLKITKETHLRYKEGAEAKEVEYQEKQERLYERYINDRKQIDDIRVLISKTDLSKEAKKNGKRFDSAVNNRFKQLWKRVDDSSAYNFSGRGSDKDSTP